jgi:dienelactone hydrolase
MMEEDFNRDLTDLIAQQGYVAIAPAMYQRIAPGFYSPKSTATRCPQLMPEKATAFKP